MPRSLAQTDDYYDLRDALKNTALEPKLELIWLAFCEQESQEMVANGQLSQEAHNAWKAKRLSHIANLRTELRTEIVAQELSLSKQKL